MAHTTLSSESVVCKKFEVPIPILHGGERPREEQGTAGVLMTMPVNGESPPVKPKTYFKESIVFTLAKTPAGQIKILKEEVP